MKIVISIELGSDQDDQEDPEIIVVDTVEERIREIRRQFAKMSRVVLRRDIQESSGSH
jgi:hypothetical protein